MPYFSQVLSRKQPCQPSEPIRIVTVCVSQVCSELASYLEKENLELQLKLWPNKCYVARTESTNAAKITWQTVDLAVGTICVYFSHTDELVPENCGIINGLAY